MNVFRFQANQLLNSGRSRHVHADIELLVVTRGHGRQLTGTGEVACDPGDVFVYPRGCPHMSATGPNESFSSMVLNVVTSDLPTEAGALLERICERAAMSNRLPVRRTTGHRVASLLRRAEGEWMSSALGSRAATQALVVAAVIALARDEKQAAPAEAVAAASDRHLDRADRWLQDYWMTPVRLADLLDLGPLGRSQFLSRFRTRTGRTVTETLLDIRLREAQRMMRAGRSTLLDVALACGFGSQSHFNHSFRNAMGRSPRAWLADLKQAELKQAD